MLFSSYPLRERQVPRWDSPLLPGGGGALGQGTEDSACLWSIQFLWLLSVIPDVDVQTLELDKCLF